MPTSVARELELPLRAERTGPSSQRGRVLMVATQPFFSERGTPIAVRYVLQALSELGHEVDLLTVPLGADVDIPGVRILRVANPLGLQRMPVGLSFAKILFDLPVFFRLRRLLRETRYECLHAVEDAAYIAMLGGHHRRVPLIYDMASSLPEQLAKGTSRVAGTLRLMLERLERALLSRAATVICSAGLASKVRSTVPAATVNEWVFPAEAPAANAWEAAALRRELGIHQDARVILYGGTFAGYQGLDLLFAALPEIMERVPESVLVCVGASDEEELRETEGLLPDGLADRVRLLKRVSKAEMPAFLCLADVLLSPRAFGGNLPLKIFDYLATGTPIVATDIPAHRSVLTDELAMLVEPTPQAFAAGVSRVLTDHDLARRMSIAALAFAADRLSWPAFVSFIDRVYAGAAAEPMGQRAKVAE